MEIKWNGQENKVHLNESLWMELTNDIEKAQIFFNLHFYYLHEIDPAIMFAP